MPILLAVFVACVLAGLAIWLLGCFFGFPSGMGHWGRGRLY